MFPTLLMTIADADPTGGSHFTLLVYVAVALAVSFLCSVWEAVLLSTPLSHIELMVQRGSRGGRRMKLLRRNVERPISAILTLNTIAHTVGAAGAGAEATLIFGSQWFGVISAVLTLLILVFSEIIPKTLGTVYCRGLAAFTGVSVTLLVRAFLPLVLAFEVVTRLFRPGKRRPSVTRAELEVMARLSAEEGGILAHELRTHQNLLRLESVRISEVMTPRTMITTLPATATVGEIIDGGLLPVFSRVPITPGDADAIDAYVLTQDILRRGAAGEHDVRLRELGRPLDGLPASRSVAMALEHFVGTRSHVALVVDEFGGTSGLITLEDSVETLLGQEIVDESDQVTDLADMARRRHAKRLRAAVAQDAPGAQSAQASQSVRDAPTRAAHGAPDDERFPPQS